MSVVLYKTEEGKPAPRVPDFLRGRFFELFSRKTIKVTDEEAYDGRAFEYEDNIYAGWIQFHEDGRIEIGEPGE